MKTSELIGDALDWAVAKCEQAAGENIREGYGSSLLVVDANDFGAPASFSTDWAQGGPIIERERIGTLFDSGSACHKPCWFATPDDQSTSCSYEGEFFDPTFMVTESVGVYGPTPLVAAMRCYVASKLGDEVEVPKP